jgi:beta-glucosidase
VLSSKKRFGYGKINCLIKNENELLPLKKSGLKIALIGALANDKTSPLGSWSAADDESAVSVLKD